jgi:prepilin-type N-terminal cleavage/methylation domain-containing protein
VNRIKEALVRDGGPDGFTLIEVLLSIVLFSLSLFALVPLLTTAVRIDKENYLSVKARAMAADTLDTLMGDALAGPNPSTETDRGVALTRSWSVSQAGNLDTIAVRVRYTYQGRVNTVQLTAQKAR